jgi:phytol kinase
LSLWLLVGFSLGTSTLLGPVRLVASLCSRAGLGPAAENAAVDLVIILLIIVTGAIAWTAGGMVLESSRLEVRLGVPALAILAAAGALWLWMSPARLRLDMGEETGAGLHFTFGPYPDEWRMRRLKAQGYTAVVTLLHPAVIPFEPKLLADEKKAAARAGIDLVEVPMLPWVSQNTGSLDRIRALARSGTGRYYVHCYLGRDRIRLAKRIVEQAAPDAGVRAPEAALLLGSVERFERGRLVRLDDRVTLTPYPTDEEFMSYIVTGEVGHVVSLLDPEDPEDRSWVDKERAILKAYDVPLLVLPLSGSGNRPAKALEAARRVRDLPGAVVVHAFLAPDSQRSPSAEAFAQAYRSEAGPRPPAPSRVEAASPVQVATPVQVVAATGRSAEPAVTPGSIGSFIERATPGIEMVVLLGPVLLLLSWTAARLVGWLGTDRRVRVPFTRKIFHFVIFTLAGVLQISAGLPAVMLLGVIVSLMVLYAVARGDGFPFYEAMARPTDQPRRTLFVLVPLLTTALGGVLANLFFGPFAAIGYLVGGWGDAVGEPVGTAWGRHRYRVPSLGGIPATRTLEGSTAVLLAGTVAAVLGLWAHGATPGSALLVGALCGLSGAAVEAFSAHGLDNLTVQIAAAGTAFLLLG